MASRMSECSQQLAWACAHAFLPYLLVCRIIFTRCVQGRGGSCETHGATLLGPVFTSIGADTLANAAVFSRMGERWHATSSCGLGRSPKTSFHYLVVLHRCFVRLSTFTYEGLCSVALLCCWWLFWMNLQGCSRSDCHLSAVREPF